MAKRILTPIVIPTGGSNVAPMLTFEGDADTGIYQGGSANQIAFVAGSTLGAVLGPGGLSLLATPTAPTPAAGDNDTSVATTAFVRALMTQAGLVGGAVSRGVADMDAAPAGVFETYNGVATDAAANHWPSVGSTGSTAQWWNVVTYGPSNRTTQIASFGFNFGLGRTFIRFRHDTTWGAWRELAFLDSPLFTGQIKVGDFLIQDAGTDYYLRPQNASGSVVYIGASEAQANRLSITDAGGALSGIWAAATAAAATNTTQIATTAFVQAATAALVDASPGTLDTLNELAAALADDPNFAATMATALALKAPLASPALTGTPTAPTAAAATSTTQIATTAFATTADALKANIASPTLTGIPAAPTAARLNNSTQLATTAYVDAAKISFCARTSATDTTNYNFNSTNYPVLFNSEEFDDGGYYDHASTYRFTPPAGRYQLNASVIHQNNSGGTTICTIRKNGVETARIQHEDVAAGAASCASGSVVVVANGTDYFDVSIYFSVGSGSAHMVYGGSVFSGVKL